MDQRKIARIMIVSILVFAVFFLAWGGYNYHKQSRMEQTLVERGIAVAGTITDLSKSSSSSSGSISPSYVIQVDYEYNGEGYSNPYSVTQRMWEEINEGEPIQITLDPQQPQYSQLSEYVGKPLNGRGFIPLD